jgi:hypothetical protein
VETEALLLIGTIATLGVVAVYFWVVRRAAQKPETR